VLSPLDALSVVDTALTFVSGVIGSLFRPAKTERERVADDARAYLMILDHLKRNGRTAARDIFSRPSPPPIRFGTASLQEAGPTNLSLPEGAGTWADDRPSLGNDWQSVILVKATRYIGRWHAMLGLDALSFDALGLVTVIRTISDGPGVGPVLTEVHEAMRRRLRYEAGTSSMQEGGVIAPAWISSLDGRQLFVRVARALGAELPTDAGLLVPLVARGVPTTVRLYRPTS